MLFMGQMTMVAHLLMPKVIRLHVAHLETFFKSLESFLLVGAQRTMSSTKRPPQQYEFTTFHTILFTTLEDVIDK